MLALIQRVNYARVSIDDKICGSIDKGMLALVGLEREDDVNKAKKLVDRLLAYRIFADAEQRMNLSLNDTGGGLLLVSQFTLAADTSRGLRPGFSSALAPELAEPLFAELLDYARAQHDPVASGRFGADMQVALENDGPVTFIIQV